MVSVKPKATKSTLPDALVASKNAYKASKLIDTLPTEWGFNMLFPEALPRTKDIASKKNMNNVIFQGCEDLETSHINEAIQNKYNIVALGWTENDSEFDPSYIFHFRSVSSEVYFTHALPKELVSFQVYMDPSLIAYSKWVRKSGKRWVKSQITFFFFVLPTPLCLSMKMAFFIEVIGKAVTLGWV